MSKETKDVELEKALKKLTDTGALRPGEGDTFIRGFLLGWNAREKQEG